MGEQLLSTGILIQLLFFHSDHVHHICLCLLCRQNRTPATNQYHPMRGSWMRANWPVYLIRKPKWSYWIRRIIQPVKCSLATNFKRSRIFAKSTTLSVYPMRCTNGWFTNQQSTLESVCLFQSTWSCLNFFLIFCCIRPHFRITIQSGANWGSGNRKFSEGPTQMGAKMQRKNQEFSW